MDKRLTEWEKVEQIVENSFHAVSDQDLGRITPNQYVDLVEARRKKRNLRVNSYKKV